jgi:hypothetical protein
VKQDYEEAKRNPFDHLGSGIAQLGSVLKDLIRCDEINAKKFGWR